MYVYILASRNHRVLYTGVTRDVQARVWQHKQRGHRGFTSRYHVDRLVYYEEIEGPYEAITREKQLKAGPRWRKEALINGVNPGWKDLSRGWYEKIPTPSLRTSSTG
jgi:putative endonuclease